MNFQVPQFIEIESKIFGPLTLPQFIYVLGGISIAFLIYVTIPFFYVAIVPMGIAVIGGIALAFYKVNNRSLIYLIQAMIKYYSRNKLYLWKKSPNKPTAPIVNPKSEPINLKNIRSNKLNELSWSLDIKENIK